MTPLDYHTLARDLSPEAMLVVGALAVIGADLTGLRRRALALRFQIATALAVLALIAAGALALRVGRPGEAFGGALMFDSLAFASRLGVYILALLVLGAGVGGRTPRQPAEYVALILFATAGFSLMGSAQQLLLMFLALETASLSLYVLAGFESWRPESAEAALKYFLFGSLSAAFLLFGFSLIYGLTGSLDLPRIAPVVAGAGFTPALGISLVMVLVAFGFKIAAAPFHFWAPDAYQGAPTLAAALIASGSKLASFAFFLRLLWTGFAPAAGALVDWHHPGQGWLHLVGALAVAALVLGNLAALVQSNLRRLLAYSAIAHSGSLLLGVIAAGAAGPGPVFYYAATYGIAVAGAFGVIAVLEKNGNCQALTDLAGLRRRSPVLALCLFVFVLSLAGIPPLAGFFGKFVVFAAALQIGGPTTPVGALAVLAILFSAVALYYYLLILKQALVAPAPETAAPLAVSPTAALVLVAAAALLLLLGLFPSLILDIFRT